MNLPNLLQTDEIAQNLVINITATLKPNECLFAVVGLWGQINFKKVKISRKNLFRKKFFGKAYYLTSQQLKNTDEVRLLGKLLKCRYEQTQKEVRSKRQENCPSY